MTLREFTSVFRHDIFYIYNMDKKLLDKISAINARKSNYSEYNVIKAERRETCMELIVNEE